VGKGFVHRRKASRVQANKSGVALGCMHVPSQPVLRGEPVARPDTRLFHWRFQCL